MRKRRENGQYVLSDYYRSDIDMDTALDARHLVSVLVSLCPDLICDFQDHKVVLRNVRNHMLQNICITWKYTI